MLMYVKKKLYIKKFIRSLTIFLLQVTINYFCPFFLVFTGHFICIHINANSIVHNKFSVPRISGSLFMGLSIPYSKKKRLRNIALIYFPRTKHFTKFIFIFKLTIKQKMHIKWNFNTLYRKINFCSLYAQWLI